MGRHRCITVIETQGIGLSCGQQELVSNRMELIRYQIDHRMLEAAQSAFSGLLQELEQCFIDEIRDPDGADLYSIGLEEREVEIFAEYNILDVRDLKRWLACGMRPAIPRIGSETESKIKIKLAEYDHHCEVLRRRLKRLQSAK